jgi:hypothetical protein
MRRDVRVVRSDRDVGGGRRARGADVLQPVRGPDRGLPRQPAAAAGADGADAAQGRAPRRVAHLFLAAHLHAPLGTNN